MRKKFKLSNTIQTMFNKFQWGENTIKAPLNPAHYSIIIHMNLLLILKRTFELHNVGLSTQMLHDLNLPLHVLLVSFAHKLPPQNGLIGILQANWILSAEINHPRLASPQFFPKCECSITQSYIFEILTKSLSVSIYLIIRKIMGCWNIN